MSARARSARTNGSLRGYLLFQNQIFFFFIFFYITWLTGFDRSPSYDRLENQNSGNADLVVNN